jgi:ABC-2 type transport system permease protein
MSGLLRVEIRRILSRRVVVAAGGLVVLGLLIAGTVLFFRSHRLDPAELAIRQQQAQASVQEAVEGCASGRFGISDEEVPPDMTLREYCEQLVGQPPIEDPAFRLVNYGDVAEGLSGLFIALVTILAASFIGAEWHAGTVTTQLTWEPRRNRVLAAKLIATGLFAFAFFILAEALLFGVLAPAAVFRGTTHGLSAAWLRGTAGLVLRGAGAAALVAGIAFAVASIARNTAAAVASVFVYIAVLEPLIRAARPQWRPWYLYDNVATFISGHTVEFSPLGRSMTGAGVLISIYTMGFVLLAMIAFWRRDVT